MMELSNVMLTGQLTVKADVYSFGVVLLEILTGSCVDKRCSKGVEGDLVQRVKPLLCSNSMPEVRSIIDEKLGKNVPMKEAHQFAKLAYRCLSQDHNSRPTMCEVVAVLEQLHHNEAGNSSHPNSAIVAKFSACPPPSSKKSSGKYGSSKKSSGKYGCV